MAERLIYLPLGGAGEIGMNLNLYEFGGKWLMVDLGVSFGEDDVPGIDVVMPDPAFIIEDGRPRAHFGGDRADITLESFCDIILRHPADPGVFTDRNLQKTVVSLPVVLVLGIVQPRLSDRSDLVIQTEQVVWSSHLYTFPA